MTLASEEDRKEDPHRRLSFLCLSSQRQGTPEVRALAAGTLSKAIEMEPAVIRRTMLQVIFFSLSLALIRQSFSCSCRHLRTDLHRASFRRMALPAMIATGSSWFLSPKRL